MKLALITGASSGLGKALAIELARQTHALILVARREEVLLELKEKLLVPVEIIIADLAKPEDRNKVIKCIQSKAPELIINCAGFGLYGPTLLHPLSDWNEMLSVNVQALLEFTIEGARTLKANNKEGTIVNISSAAAFFSYPTFCVYAATKAFALTFSEGIDAELKANGIRVLTACPGQIDTDFRAHASGHFPQKKDHLTMSTKTAVDCIFHQIKTGKAVFVFDWKYRWMVYLSKLIPKCWLNLFLQNSLKERYARKND